jgi:hypothetical protein
MISRRPSQARLSEEVTMSAKAQGKARTRKGLVARDLTARKTTRLTGGVIVYNGHAGLGANAVLTGAGAGARAATGIVTDNKDPDGKY